MGKCKCDGCDKMHENAQDQQISMLLGAVPAIIQTISQLNTQIQADQRNALVTQGQTQMSYQTALNYDSGLPMQNVLVNSPGGFMNAGQYSNCVTVVKAGVYQITLRVTGSSNLDPNLSVNVKVNGNKVINSAFGGLAGTAGGTATVQLPANANVCINFYGTVFMNQFTSGVNPWLDFSILQVG
jgi:hypothetical protein